MRSTLLRVRLACIFPFCLTLHLNLKGLVRPLRYAADLCHRTASRTESLSVPATSARKIPRTASQKWASLNLFSNFGRFIHTKIPCGVSPGMEWVPESWLPHHDTMKECKNNKVIGRIFCLYSRNNHRDHQTLYCKSGQWGFRSNSLSVWLSQIPRASARGFFILSGYSSLDIGWEHKTWRKSMLMFLALFNTSPQ